MNEHLLSFEDKISEMNQKILTKLPISEFIEFK